MDKAILDDAAQLLIHHVKRQTGELHDFWLSNLVTKIIYLHKFWLSILVTRPQRSSTVKINNIDIEHSQVRKTLIGPHIYNVAGLCYTHRWMDESQYVCDFHN